MTSQPGKQTIPLPILSNISISKSDQTMKFGQLIEITFSQLIGCNMKKIFLVKSCVICGGETILRPFSNKWN